VSDAPTNEGGGEAIDQTLVRAISNPLRVEILRALHGRASSPNRLAPELGESLSLVSYHVRVLVETGAIRLVKEVQRRGATEHYYTAEPRSMIGHQDWRRVPPAARPGVTNEAVRTLFDEIGAAIDAETIDRREDTTLSWMPITVDHQGWLEAAELLQRTARDLIAIHDRSSERLGDADGIAVVTALAAFEAAPARPGVVDPDG
jgi:DNA-binding transcriptional ArsR family regulator